MSFIWTVIRFRPLSLWISASTPSCRGKPYTFLLFCVINTCKQTVFVSKVILNETFLFSWTSYMDLWFKVCFGCPLVAKTPLSLCLGWDSAVTRFATLSTVLYLTSPSWESYTLTTTVCPVCPADCLIWSICRCACVHDSTNSSSFILNKLNHTFITGCLPSFKQHH